MYAKVFEQILDSSIAEDYQVRHVFEDMLKLATQDGIVDRTHEAIARRINVPLEIVVRAITELEKPDARSRSRDQDGRRLVRLDPARDWGWKIVNHSYYRTLRTADDKRQADKERQRLYREKDTTEKATKCDNKLQSVTPVSVYAYESGSEDGEFEGKANPFTPAQFAAAAKSVKCPDADRDACWAFYDSQGWKKSNGMTITGDPRSIITSWMTNPRRLPEAGKPSSNGHREAWKIEADIKTVREQMSKAIPATRYGYTDGILKLRKLAATNDKQAVDDLAAYEALKQRKAALETELRQSV